jgi:hypothetical protein
MKAFIVNKNAYIYIRAENEDEAIEKAKKIEDAKWNSCEFNIDEKYETEDMRNLLTVLKNFRGSVCETEWLKMQSIMESGDIPATMRMLADFMEKEEFKKYNAKMQFFDKPCLVFSVGEEERFYRFGFYDIDEDIKHLEKYIADDEKLYRR